MKRAIKDIELKYLQSQIQTRDGIINEARIKLGKHKFSMTLENTEGMEQPEQVSRRLRASFPNLPNSQTPNMNVRVQPSIVKVNIQNENPVDEKANTG